MLDDSIQQRMIDEVSVRAGESSRVMGSCSGGDGGREKSPNEVRNDVMPPYVSLLSSSFTSILSPPTFYSVSPLSL